MNSTDESAKLARAHRWFDLKIPALSLLALFLAIDPHTAHGKCVGYINSDGSLQTSTGESDCGIGVAPSRVSTGVYRIGVGYPLDSEIDEETGVYTYIFTQGICTASISDDGSAASSISISSTVKPDHLLHEVPEGSNDVIFYTVRTFSAVDGLSLVPTDQDFTMACQDWMPYVPMLTAR
ncbi:hypothetical protein [Lysobacter enzymogenes]|uniref:hypothetical protein n=1 Tax=Lysobacter enzymogenes TaxID=69 RepID=UPI001A97B4B2|nr:hypothetical protein [Lysobacter enzymogenes]QQP95301.1 hypothetical protein JHW38_18970 [Lysobacter enzymogenes]